MRKIIFAIIIISLGILFRTRWHLYPNMEFVTAATLLSAVYLGRKWAILVPIIIMGFSDYFIGNTNIFIFTWSGFILMGLMARNIAPWKNAVLASLFFYFWTNFGVWALDFYGMYSKDLSGLLRCYYMGLPFLRFNLVGNLIFVPLSFWVVEKAKIIFSVLCSRGSRGVLLKFWK